MARAEDERLYLKIGKPVYRYQSAFALDVQVQHHSHHQLHSSKMDIVYHPGVNGSDPYVDFYPYTPSATAGYAFTAIFGISTLIHIILTIPYRAAYFIPLVLGGICTIYIHIHIHIHIIPTSKNSIKSNIFKNRRNIRLLRPSLVP